MVADRREMLDALAVLERALEGGVLSFELSTRGEGVVDVAVTPPCSLARFKTSSLRSTRSARPDANVPIRGPLASSSKAANSCNCSSADERMPLAISCSKEVNVRIAMVQMCSARESRGSRGRI